MRANVQRRRRPARVLGVTLGLAALLAVVTLCVLPGVAGRLTFVGVEASHLAVLTWSVLLLLRLRDGPPATAGWLTRQGP